MRVRTIPCRLLTGQAASVGEVSSTRVVSADMIVYCFVLSESLSEAGMNRKTSARLEVA